jgi:TonB family protein
MNPLFHYLLKSGFAIFILYLFYILFLKQDGHFLRNRIYLICVMILSLGCPFFNIPQEIFVQLGQPGPTLKIPSFLISMDGANAGAYVPEAISCSLIPRLLFVVYIAGMLFFLARIIWGIYELRKILSNGPRELKQGVLVYFRESGLPHFSILNRIVINPSFLQEEKKELEQVLAHEHAHISQMHWLDLAMLEITSVIQWFNPAIWLLGKELKDVHEFLADKQVIEKGCSRSEYQAVLVNQALGIRVFRLTNNFNQSNLKKRLLMLTQIKTNKLASLKLLLAVPVLIGLLLITAHRPDSSSQTNQIKVTGVVTDVDNGNALEGAVVIIGGTTEGTITDKSGKFEITMPANAELVISHVGYGTVSTKPSKEFMKIEMNMAAIIMNLDEKSQPIEFKEQAKQSQGQDVYVAVEEIPSFPGGVTALNKYLSDNLKYPEVAKQAKQEGKVYINVLINEQGQIEGDIKVIRAASPGLAEEAVRVIKNMPKWNPGMQNGKPIKALVTIPVEFKLK